MDKRVKTKHQVKQADITDYLDLKSSKYWLFWNFLATFIFGMAFVTNILDAKRNLLVTVGDTIFFIVYIPILKSSYKKYRTLSIATKDEKSKSDKQAQSS